jgi:hypothetical protein
VADEVGERSSSQSGNDRTSAEWAQRERVWSAKLPRMEKYVLIAFLDFDRAAEGKLLFPSLDRIAWQTCCTRTTVRFALRALERRGILERVGTIASRYGLRGRVAQFRFHRDALPTRPNWAAHSGSESSPVNDDSGSESSAVESRQRTVDDTTVGISRPDSAHSTARQRLATIHDRTEDRTEDRRSRATRAGARESAPEKKTEDPEESAEPDDWFQECKRLHGRACAGRYAHGLRLETERLRARHQPVIEANDTPPRPAPVFDSIVTEGVERATREGNLSPSNLTRCCRDVCIERGVPYDEGRAREAMCRCPALTGSR